MGKIILIVDNYSIGNIPRLNELVNHNISFGNNENYEIRTIRVNNENSTVNIIANDMRIQVQVSSNGNPDLTVEVNYNNNDQVIILIDHPGEPHSAPPQDMYVSSVTVNNTEDITAEIRRGNVYPLNANCTISKINHVLQSFVNAIINRNTEELGSLLGQL